MKSLLYLNKFFYKYKTRFILGIIITIVAQIFALYTPKLISASLKEIEDFIKNSPVNSEAIYAILLENILLIIATTMISGFFTFLMRQTLIVMSRYVEFDLKNEIYAHYQTLSQNFLKQNRTGDLMNRITEDVAKVRMYVGPAIMYTINTFIRFVIVIIYMTAVSPKLTLYSLLPLPLLSYLIFKISTDINKKSTLFQENLSKLSSFSQEVFSGIRIIKNYALHPIFKEKFNAIAEDSKQKNIDLAKTNAYFGPMMILLIGISNLLVIYIGGVMYINNEIKIGTIVEFIIYINMLTWPVASLGWVSSLVQEAAASQTRLNEFLKEKSEIVNYNEEKINIIGKITFENVSFTYPETGIKALDNINFEVSAGKTLAILGNTGSGKSTILQLLYRMYALENGKILIDGHKIETINLFELRNQMSIVPQDGFLFSDTIEENIKFGKIDATIEEIEEVCKAAHIHHNIISFKDGYQTLLGERGITLSGGQKQRVSMARALIKNSNIILLDDCLSAVDTETEEIILNNLNQNISQKTAIIVSHRVSSVKNTDQIIVLDEGKIIEKGTHNELINHKGAYFELYQKQLFEKK
jgi:ATP-binding cassette, subfamily B, multidrug efflux pump